MATYVIGDIHGMLEKLDDLLATIPFDTARDTLAFIGDYIDRGRESRGVIERILELGDDGVRTLCIRGNHEAMLQDYLAGREQAFYLANGGEATLESYANYAEFSLPARHVRFLERLLPWAEVEGEFLLVHGGLRPGVPLAEQTAEDLYWIRWEFIGSRVDFGRRVVFGHTPFREPYVDPFKIGIDTGAVYGNVLTCVRLPDVAFFSV